MSATKGYLHIFNVSCNRSRSENDVELLRETFQIMGAEVECTTDPDKKILRGEMGKIKLKDFTNYLYVAIAFMAHGNDDGVVELQDKEIIVILKTILIPLCNMESLNGKLKWVIMQSCRGSYDFIQQSTEGPSPTIKFPKYCVKFFATSEGMRAWRGMLSIFLEALCKRLREEYEEHDIISIFNRCIDDVASIKISIDKKLHTQTPSVEDNLGTKKFYITSGFR